MQAYFNARRSRLLATVMVFVWLLGVGLGFANACLLSPQVAGNGHPSLVTVAVVHAHDAHHHDHATVSPAALACLALCTAEQSTVIQAKAQFDGLQAMDLAPIPLLVGFLRPRVEQNVQPRPVRCAPCSDPPVSIRFLRLTI